MPESKEESRFDISIAEEHTFVHVVDTKTGNVYTVKHVVPHNVGDTDAYVTWCEKETTDEELSEVTKAVCKCMEGRG